MRTGLCVACVVVVGVWAAVGRGAEHGRLAPLARFVGEWRLEAKWADGTPLRARAEYEWGLEKTILRGRTFLINDEGKERQRYEDVLAWDARRNSIVDVSFSVDGAVNHIVIESKAPDTLLFGWRPYEEGTGGRMRQTIRFEGNDRFVWIVEVNAEGEWKQIMNGAWLRVGAAPTGS